MRFLEFFDIGYEVYLATLEVITVIVLRKSDIESYLISDFCTDKMLLESRDKRS